MEALHGKRLGAARVGDATGGEQFDAVRHVGANEFGDRLGVEFDIAVPRGGIRGTALLNGDRRKEHEFRSGMEPSDFAQVDLILLAECRAAPANDSSSLAQHDNLRAPCGEQGLEVLDVALGPEKVADFVACPRETANAEFFAGMRELKAGFEVT